MAKKKINEASNQLNPAETKILTHVLDHPEILDQVKNASDPVQELGSLVDMDELGIDPNAAYELEDVLQFLDINEADSLDERKVTDTVVAAFLAGDTKKVGNTSTDGHSLFLHGNEIATRGKDGVFITDAGWATPTTRDRLNGLLKALGVDVGVFQKHGTQMISRDGKEEPWDGKPVKIKEDWEGSSPTSAQALVGRSTQIPMMADKKSEEDSTEETEKKEIILPKWAKKYKAEVEEGVTHGH
jgi:hypothetical protein